MSELEINKKDVIQLLEKIALYMELKGENPFKISAYRKAAAQLEADERTITEIGDFTTIKGIGKGTNAVIVEYIQTGHSGTLAQLEKEVPSGLIPLLRVPGLGGKKLSKLYQELGITDYHTLKQAILDQKVEKLSGFGKKSAKNILQALEQVNTRPERIPIAVVLPIAEQIKSYLQKSPIIQAFSVAGSLRRMEETVKDIDFIIATDKPTEVRQYLLAMDDLKEVISSGDTKITIELNHAYGIHVDFRLVEQKEFATTLHHFTGSKDHNVALRQLAKVRGEKINEYGVEIEETNEILTFSSEKEFFRHFGLYEIPPEARNNKGEIEIFQHQSSYLKVSDIRGDLHMHTTWSDGAHSVEEMVLSARDKGYEYIAITDHSKSLRIANGLDETRLRIQREEIERLNEKYSDIHIFAGVEMDILPDGRLDFSNDFLQEMDFVIAAIHSSFKQSEEQIMYRLFQALENPYVSLIAHPTGRLIGRRDGYKVDVERLIDHAKQTNTALEINSNPNRLDLSSEWAEMAYVNGVRIAINTDAHHKKRLEQIKYGVGVARKAGLQKENVINAWSKEQLLSFFNEKK